MTSQIYRAFRINEAGHIVGPPEVILCDTDAAAIEQATMLISRSDYGIQLWHLARLVIRLPSLAADSDEVARVYRYEVARGFRDDVAHLSDLISPGGEALWPVGSLASVKLRGQSGIAA